MKLHETNHNSLLPEVGTKVNVWIGQMSDRRAVEGEVVKTTATMIDVRYNWRAPRFEPREITERFRKKDGSRHGDGGFIYGPRVGLIEGAP